MSTSFESVGNKGRKRGKSHDLDGALGGNDAVHALRERIETLVNAPHELGLQQVAGRVIELEFALIQLHRQIRRLEVEGHHLTSRIPEDLRSSSSSITWFFHLQINNCELSINYLGHVIGRVDSGSFGEDAAHLALVIVDELDTVGLEVVHGRHFGE